LRTTAFPQHFRLARFPFPIPAAQGAPLPAPSFGRSGPAIITINAIFCRRDARLRHLFIHFLPLKNIFFQPKVQEKPAV
jgi:hypothetical protein